MTGGGATSPQEGTPVALGASRATTGPDPFCRWCGRPKGGCDQATCRRQLDPPRHCPTCGRRLRVLVTPTGVSAECRDHGALVS